jgi:hypothetical protein
MTAEPASAITLETLREAVEAMERESLKPPRPLIVCKAEAPLLHAELTARPIPGYVLIDEWPMVPRS